MSGDHQRTRPCRSRATIENVENLPLVSRHYSFAQDQGSCLTVMDALDPGKTRPARQVHVLAVHMLIEVLAVHMLIEIVRMLTEEVPSDCRHVDTRSSGSFQRPIPAGPLHDSVQTLSVPMRPATLYPSGHTRTHDRLYQSAQKFLNGFCGGRRTEPHMRGNGLHAFLHGPVTSSSCRAWIRPAAPVFGTPRPRTSPHRTLIHQNRRHHGIAKQSRTHRAPRRRSRPSLYRRRNRRGQPVARDR